MACSCIELMQAALKDKGVRLRVSVNMYTMEETIPCYVEERGDSGFDRKQRRARITYLVATFCPFCGSRYKEPQEADHAAQ